MIFEVRMDYIRKCIKILLDISVFVFYLHSAEIG